MVSTLQTTQSLTHHLPTTANYLEEIDLSVSWPDESCVNVVGNAREALADLLRVVGVHGQVGEAPVFATLRNAKGLFRAVTPQRNVFCVNGGSCDVVATAIEEIIKFCRLLFPLWLWVCYIVFVNMVLYFILLSKYIAFTLYSPW